MAEVSEYLRQLANAFGRYPDNIRMENLFTNMFLFGRRGTESLILSLPQAFRINVRDERNKILDLLQETSSSDSLKQVETGIGKIIKGIEQMAEKGEIALVDEASPPSETSATFFPSHYSLGKPREKLSGILSKLRSDLNAIREEITQEIHGGTDTTAKEQKSGTANLDKLFAKKVVKKTTFAEHVDTSNPVKVVTAIENAFEFCVRDSIDPEETEKLLTSAKEKLGRMEKIFPNEKGRTFGKKIARKIPGQLESIINAVRTTQDSLGEGEGEGEGEEEEKDKDSKRVLGELLEKLQEIRNDVTPQKGK